MIGAAKFSLSKGTKSPYFFQERWSGLAPTTSTLVGLYNTWATTQSPGYGFNDGTTLVNNGTAFGSPYWYNTSDVGAIPRAIGVYWTNTGGIPLARLTANIVIPAGASQCQLDFDHYAAWARNAGNSGYYMGVWAFLDNSPGVGVGDWLTDASASLAATTWYDINTSPLKHHITYVFTCSPGSTTLSFDWGTGVFAGGPSGYNPTTRRRFMNAISNITLKVYP